jgi:anti-sigma regulatory factor (Ser/Thr protein kinase)
VSTGAHDHRSFVSGTPNVTPCGGYGFAHEVVFYAGLAEFTSQATSFVNQGLDRGEPVMVMVGPAKLDALREALGRGAKDVSLVNMEEIGRNPARIIPVWAAFFAARADGSPPARGIGEPISSGRTEAELLECQLHESLINLAFATGRDRLAFATGPHRLLCPYDVETLGAAEIDEARRGHPLVTDQTAIRINPACEERPWLDRRFTAPLPAPCEPAVTLAFDGRSVASVRALVSRSATASGLAPARVDDAVLAAHELAANSVRHGGGQGILRVWSNGSAIVCEVTDSGVIDDPLVGRHLPALDSESGRGLWMVNSLADLSQIRSGPAGTTVRLHVSS